MKHTYFLPIVIGVILLFISCGTTHISDYRYDTFIVDISLDLGKECLAYKDNIMTLGLESDSLKRYDLDLSDIGGVLAYEPKTVRDWFEIKAYDLGLKLKVKYFSVEYVPLDSMATQTIDGTYYLPTSEEKHKIILFLLSVKSLLHDKISN